MIEQYYNFHNGILSFQVVRFVEDHQKHVLTLKNMRSELNDLDTIKSIEYDKTKVQSSQTSDPTAQLAIIKQHLENKIAEYEAMVNLYDRTMASLSREDRMILETMYSSDTIYPYETLQEELHIERATLYRWRARAIKNFETFLTGFLLP